MTDQEALTELRSFESSARMVGMKTADTFAHAIKAIETLAMIKGTRAQWLDGKADAHECMKRVNEILEAKP